MENTNLPASAPPPRRDLVRESLRVLGFSVLAGVIAYLASFLFAPRYESYATYYFPLNSQPQGLAALAGAAQGDRSSATMLGGALPSPLVGSAPQTAIGILASRTCRSLVRDELAKEGVKTNDLTDKQLENMTDAKVDRNGMLRLGVTAEDPSLAKSIAQAYQRAFEQIAQKLTLNVSKRNRILLQNRLARLQKQADSLERMILRAVARPNAIDLDIEREAMIQAHRQLLDTGQKRVAIEAKLRSLISTLGKIYDAEAKHPGLSSNATSPLIEALQQRRLAFEDARRAFQPGSTEYQQTQRDYVAVSQLIQSLAKHRMALASAGIDPQSAESVADYAGLTAAEAELKRQIEDLRHRASTNASGARTIDGLKADLSQTRKTITQLDSEYQVALIAEARDPSRFEVLDEPEADTRPVFPRRLLIAALAAALVFAASTIRIAVGWVRDQEAAAQSS